MPTEFPLVEPLSSRHVREEFDCGEPGLNDYLRRQATQDMRRGVSRVFVARAGSSWKIAGYYTLSATSFKRDDLPAQEARRLPRYPIPAALLGRLAVDRPHQGRSLGKYLLFDALERVLQASDTLAVYALVVDAMNDRAWQFYRHYGFIGFPETPKRLFLPLETLQAVR